MLSQQIKKAFQHVVKALKLKKVSFFILGYTGATVKQFTVSRRFLCIGSVCFSFFLILSTLILYDYLHLKTTYNQPALENKIAKQADEIVNQRKQIQEFASEINTLKTNLVTLNDFEKKIRIIANIGETGEQDNLFGVGGSIPEDLDARIPLTEKHNSLMREMHEQGRQLNQASSRQQDVFESLYNNLDTQRNLLSSTPAIRPTKGWISSRFGYRKSPFTGLREFHKGLDIANRKGTQIIASADGIVTFAGRNGFLGKTVKIDHGHGMATRYGHLQKVLIKRGEAVKRGDVIALMGNSGRSTGPHLHYEVFLNGIPVNPKKYILN
jgi:murein DD-endopeptidase MepM/ murein hydrolase activator NlpD